MEKDIDREKFKEKKRAELEALYDAVNEETLMIAENPEKFGSVKNVGVEDTPRISEPLSFFEKTLFSSAPTGVSHR